MTEILKQVHNLAVPHSDGKVIEKIVFGGDVLTNEGAFSAQAAMQNNETDTERLTGVIHRPEGLHRHLAMTLVLQACCTMVRMDIHLFPTQPCNVNVILLANEL